MPMSGVRCPSCASAGQEVWVIPGRSCGFCGGPCDGSNINVPKPSIQKGIHHCNELIFKTRVSSREDHDQQRHGSTASILLDKFCTVQNGLLKENDGRFYHADKSGTEQEHGGEFKMLVRIVDSKQQKCSDEEIRRLNDSWFLPFEWMETTPCGQTLQVSYCRIKNFRQISPRTPYFQLLLRYQQDSIITTIVVSSSLQTKSVRCLWVTQVPKNAQCYADGEVEKSIDGMIKKLHDTVAYTSHPLLIPIFFVEHRLQDLEQQSTEGFSPATYRTINRFIQFMRQPAENILRDGTQADIQGTAEGIYNAHHRIMLRKQELSKIRAMLRAIEEGIDLLTSVGSSARWTEEYVVDCVNDRVGFFKERIRALENQTKLAAEEFATVETMSYNVINQQDSRLSYSISQDSKKIAEATHRDSTIMVTIAFMTVTFLPGAFVAGIFGAGLLKASEPSEGEMVSKQFGLFWALTIPMTVVALAFLVITTWGFDMRKKKKKKKNSDEYGPERGKKDSLFQSKA